MALVQAEGYYGDCHRQPHTCVLGFRPSRNPAPHATHRLILPAPAAGGIAVVWLCQHPTFESRTGRGPGKEPDLSGHWEKNYQLSDDFNSRFRLYIADLQRLYSSPQGRPEPQGFGGAGFSNQAINGLARFAEEVSRMPLMDIQQDNKSVRVERDSDFTLRCQYEDKQYKTSSNPFGADACGWSDQRLLFQMNLDGGLTITHQFSLSADSSMLNVTTKVSSSAVAAPIVISNFYQRYQSPEDQYDCLQTLTRNKVCTQRRSTR